MRKEKLKKLGQKANQHVRIDYSRYEVEEAVAAIADVMVLPLYIGRALALPVFGSLLAFIAVAWLPDGAIIQKLGYLVLAWPTALPFCILLGFVLLFRQLRKDVTTVFSVALDTTGKVYEDTRALRKKAKEEGVKASFYEVFQGLTYMVILPSVHRVLERKLPLVGGLLAHGLDRVFMTLMRLRKKDMEALEEEVEAEVNENDPDSVAQAKLEAKLERMKEKANKNVGFAMRVLATPLFVATVLVGFVTLLLQWLWYGMFF